MLGVVAQSPIQPLGAPVVSPVWLAPPRRALFDPLTSLLMALPAFGNGLMPHLCCRARGAPQTPTGQGGPKKRQLKLSFARCPPAAPSSRRRLGFQFGDDATASSNAGPAAAPCSYPCATSPGPQTASDRGTRTACAGQRENRGANRGGGLGPACAACASGAPVQGRGTRPAAAVGAVTLPYGGQSSKHVAAAVHRRLPPTLPRIHERCIEAVCPPRDGGVVSWRQLQLALRCLLPPAPANATLQAHAAPRTGAIPNDDDLVGGHVSAADIERTPHDGRGAHGNAGNAVVLAGQGPSRAPPRRLAAKRGGEGVSHSTFRSTAATAGTPGICGAPY